jgi:hypothetical protein
MNNNNEMTEHLISGTINALFRISIYMICLIPVIVYAAAAPLACCVQIMQRA